MSDMEQDARDPAPESERIRKWREERLREAERQKQERISAMAQERADAAATAKEEQYAVAACLVPDAEDIGAAHKRMAAQRRRKARRDTIQIIITVLLPTLLVFVYLTEYATPLFETHAVIAIAQPNRGTPATGSGFIGGLLSPNGLSQAFMANEFVRSPALMSRLEGQTSIVSRLSGDAMDPVQRLRGQKFARFVESAVNVQTGMMDLYVRLPDPDEAVQLAETIIDLTAGHINALESSLRDQTVEFSSLRVDEARAELTSARQELVRLQLDSREANPQLRIEGLYQSIADTDEKINELRFAIDKAAVSNKSDSFETTRTRELVSRMEAQADAARRALVTGDGDTPPLSVLLMEYEMAKLRVRIAEETLTAALASFSTARSSAELGRSVVQVVVAPQRPRNPAYPNTLTSLLITLLIGVSAHFTLRATTRN